MTYRNLGEFGKALEYHEKHLNISKQVGDLAGEAGIANYNLGLVSRNLGDFKRAISTTRYI